MDVHNLCFVLRRAKEKKGLRGMRYHLTPEHPIRVVFEPWEREVICGRSFYEGKSEQVIRVWGRRRLHILKRLIPVANKFTVHLLGTGMPSFYIADLGNISFTLGLSGWTANDWASAGNFDLLAPRSDVDDFTKRRVFDALKFKWADTADALASRLNLDRAVVLGALGGYTQAGRAIYDLNKQLWRVRELSREALPMDKLRFATPREESATRFVTANAVTINEQSEDTAGNLHLGGSVRDKEKIFLPKIVIDRDEHMFSAQCTCNWYLTHKLYQGPCEHMLALRKQQKRK